MDDTDPGTVRNNTVGSISVKYKYFLGTRQHISQCLTANIALFSESVVLYPIQCL